jgi:hypothetical protein
MEKVHSPRKPGPVQETSREPHTDAEREVLMKLRTDEQAKVSSCPRRKPKF